jgi:hypothetical protein
MQDVMRLAIEQNIEAIELWIIELMNSPDTDYASIEVLKSQLDSWYASEKSLVLV